MSKKQDQNSSSRNVSRFHECCPLKLVSMPTGICENGLTRARWMADNFGYLAFEEKQQAPGCPFGILTEDKHSYCFFKLMADADGKAIEEADMVRMLALSKEQIRKIVETASAKLKGTELVKELHALHKDGGLFQDNEEFDNDIYFPDGFSADSVVSDGIVEDSVEIKTGK